MDIFKEAREFCRERLEPEFLSEKEEKDYREAAEGTPEWEDYLKTWKAWDKAKKAVLATPEGKAEDAAWEAMWAIPEWEAWKETDEALEKIEKAKYEAKKAVKATPEYKALKKAEKAL